MLSNLKLTLTNRNLCISETDLQETVKIVDKASAELRRIAQNMMPEALVKFGLIAALEDLCAELESHARIQTSFQHYGLSEPLPSHMTLPLYRIVQEALNNVVKHAQASEVMVQLIRQDDALHLTIEDNGTGFQRETTLENGGSGLKNLQSRTLFLNGHIEFDSAPGAGTAINIDIPLRKET
jgi:signal transduction histidine kinase